MLYLSEHFHRKIKQHAIVTAGTTVHLLKDIFFLVYKVNLYYFCCTAKTVNKQGCVHVSYQETETIFFECYEYSFFLQIFQVF